MQIIRDPIDTVEVKVLTSQTHTYKLGRVIRDQRFFAPDENLGDKPGAPSDSVLSINTWKTISIGFLYISLCKG